MRSMAALCERAWLLKVAGRLDEALDVANQAVRLARFAANRHDLVEPRILRAQVLHFQGKLADAIAELTVCVDESEAHDWTALRAVALQNRGKVSFEAGDLTEALNDFHTAADLRRRLGAPEDQLEASRLAIAATESLLESRRRSGV